MNNYITYAILMAKLILLFSGKKDDEGPQVVAHIQFFDNFKDNSLEGDLGDIYMERKLLQYA